MSLCIVNDNIICPSPLVVNFNDVLVTSAYCSGLRILICLLTSIEIKDAPKSAKRVGWSAVTWLPGL